MQEVVNAAGHCFTILVAGHRNDRLDKVTLGPVWSRLDAVLERVAQIVRQQEATIRVLTGAADGTDEQAAHIAKARNLDLHLLVPGTIGDLPPSHGAQRVVALGASRELQESDQRIIALRDQIALAFADMLVVVWDRKAARGQAGGTVRLIMEAVNAGRPVVHVDVSGDCFVLASGAVPEDERLRLSTFDAPPEWLYANAARDLFQPCTDDLLRMEILRQLTYDKVAAGSEHGNAGGAPDGLDSPPVRGNYGERLLAVLHRRCSGIALALAGRLPRRKPAGNRSRPVAARYGGSLSTVQSQFDAAANVGAKSHRGMTWLLYFLSSLAVFAAVGGAIDLWRGSTTHVWPLVELLALTLVMVFVLAWKRETERRPWLQYRFIAEQLRIVAGGAPFAVIPQAFLTPVYGRNHHDASAGKVFWRLQRVLRDAGLPANGDNMDLDFSCLSFHKLRNDIVALLDNQIDYQSNKRDDNSSIHKTLHTLTMVLFAAAFAAVIAHFLVHAEALLIATAFGPALAAAMHGIMTKLEIAREAHGAAAMAEELTLLKKAVEGLPPAANVHEIGLVQWLRLRDLAARALTTMAGENHRWLETVSAQKIEIPA